MLAKDGAKIVAVARRKDKLDQLVADITAGGGYAIAVEADVTSLEAMQKAAEAAVGTYGTLDVWVNNAGVMPLSPVEMNRIDEWNWMVDVNIKGVLNGVAAAQQPCASKALAGAVRERQFRRWPWFSGRRCLLRHQIRRARAQRRGHPHGVRRLNTRDQY